MFFLYIVPEPFSSLEDIENQQEHNTKTGQESSSNMSINFEFGGKMFCWFCNFSVDGHENLVKHLVGHRYCAICKVKFDTSNTKWFEEHMFQLHQIEIPPTPIGMSNF